MRICHVIDYFHTDVGYQEFFLARDQARAGHDVTVVTSTHRHHSVAVPGPDEQLGLDELTEAGVVLVRLPARQLGHDRSWMHGLERAVAEARPEAAHVHGPFSPTTVRAVRAARRAGAGVLVDSHLQDGGVPASRSLPNRAVYAAYGATAGALLRRWVGCWVTNGPLERAFLTSHLRGLADHDVELIPLGFDPDAFGWDPDRRWRARATLAAAPDEVVVAVTGKLHPGKRPEAVAAACQARSADRPVRLVLAGTITPESLDAVHAAAPGLLASGAIVQHAMLGRHELADLYHAADAVVFGGLASISIYEGTGTGARVLVTPDAFADWLHHLCPSVEPVPMTPLDLGDLVPDDDATRAARAERAAAAFAWPRVAAQFVDRYRSLPRRGAGS